MIEHKNNVSIDLQEEHLSLQERVYLILKDWILSGELPAKAPLNTNHLSKQLNVSRTPVRDAINKLVASGLAVKVANKEARVADFMTDEMNEIFRTRAALEGIAASAAATYMGQQQKELLADYEKQAARCSEVGDEQGFMEIDEKFHFLIYESLRTQTLEQMTKQLYLISKHNRATGYRIEGR